VRRVFAGMRCERRQPTRREWAQITRSRLVASAVIRSGTPCKARHPMNAGGRSPFGPGLTNVREKSEGGASSR